ncbi:hypothetical protein GOD71_28175 [Sinorhizobium medicae]|nr:hypothetical protein [Sinorhizobium medicae]MDX0567302.1 hypothetical protein [Sinorhizobium medicae]MDX0579958.1 hypothetical protein [Sinorhizobium medicae]MDX0648239.1 hypothetical protein [Sinorhizobium medicae]MDX0741365.1 hypothetical protein [Sinorhizobium medicae]
MSSCDSCQAAFNELPQQKKAAEALDVAHPNCACEAFKVSKYSPGPVTDDEVLYRMIVLPGDFDETEQLTFESVKALFKNGLSVFRECASDDDIRNLAEDRLYIKTGAEPRTIHGFIKLVTSEVRALEHAETVGRICCVYDETVNRKFDPEAPHVSTHAGLFQRMLEAKTKDRKSKTEQAAEVLFDYMRDRTRWVGVEDFRGGKFVALNAASKERQYEYVPAGKS